MNRFLRVSGLLGALLSVRLSGAIHTEVVEYRHGDTVLEGLLADDDSKTGVRPGIVVVHQWKGLSDHEKQRAVQLAELGYVAFAADHSFTMTAEDGSFNPGSKYNAAADKRSWEAMKAHFTEAFASQDAKP